MGIVVGGNVTLRVANSVRNEREKATELLEVEIFWGNESITGFIDIASVSPKSRVSRPSLGRPFQRL